MKWIRRQVLAPSALRVALGGVALAGVTIGASFAGPEVASAAEPAKLKAAAESFEAGAKAFKDSRFEEAAAHFEAADEAVPSAKALRLAVRSRREARQHARAASLAALALERYPDDPETKTLAGDAVLELGAKLHRVDISCVSPCVLAVTGSTGGARAVHGNANTRWTVFVEPGYPTIGASFTAVKLDAPAQKIAAKAGGSSTLRFVPEGSVAPAEPPGAGAPPSSSSGGDADDPSPPRSAPSSAPDDVGPSVSTSSSGGGLSPVFFIVGLAATAGLGGVTVWSGIDTQNDPGPDAVREACAGLGTECPAYQDGQSKELRTNVLIGATAGAAVLTAAVGLFFTDWGGSSEPDEAASFRPRVWVDVLGGPGAAPSSVGSSSEVRVTGGVLNLAGHF